MSTGFIRGSERLFMIIIIKRSGKMTYKIVWKYRDPNHSDHNKVVAEGLTLEQVRAHCSDESTHKAGVWFDCYYIEE